MYINKYIFILVSFFFVCTTGFGQWLNSKPMYSVVEHGALYVVDSIPIKFVGNNYTIPSDEIDHINVVKGRDSLKVEKLGKMAYFDSTIYIFTKKYANRPDSLKKIPSSKQMEVVDGVWKLHGVPYSGKYIDYYDNGQKQSVGVLFNGKLAYGEDYLVYYKDGTLADKEKHFSIGDKSDYRYSDSMFYLNGSLYRTGLASKIKNGKSFIIEKEYFLNGQLSEYSSSIKDSASGVTYVDTIRRYNSCGKLIESHITDTTTEKYKTMMERIRDNSIKIANGKHIKMYKQKSDDAVVKLNSKLIKSDSTNARAYFEIGRVKLRQLNYDAAISYFDKALHFEPFLLEASLHRSYARIKRDEYEIIKNKSDAQGDGSPKYLFSFGSKKLSSFLKNKFEISDKEREIICTDLQRAEQYPENFPLREDYYSFITHSLLQYCNIKSNKFPVYLYKIYY